MSDETILIEYYLQAPYLSFFDTDGKVYNGEELLKKKGDVLKQIALTALVSPMLTTIKITLKVELYNDKIRFIRCNKLAKPTDQQITVNGNDIISVVQANSFFDKSITIILSDNTKYQFEAPKKQRESVVKIINGMISQPTVVPQSVQAETVHQVINQHEVIQSSVTKPAFCSKCGNKLGENANFCGKCGNRIEWKQITQ